MFGLQEHKLPVKYTGRNLDHKPNVIFRTVRSQILTRDCDGVGMMNEAEHDQSVLGNLGDWEGPEFLGIGLVWLIIAPLIALLRTRRRPWRDVEEGPSQRRSGV